MGYQFIHLESYSRKPDSKGRNTDFIFGEVSRKPEASIHVLNPSPPVFVYGVGIEDLQAMHDAAASAAVINVEGGKTRKIRKDQKTLHTVIASHPYTMEEVRADPAKRAEAEEWEERTVGWLRSLYGDDLKSVIRHEDESHFHIHAYVLPDSDASFKAQKYHPGVVAKRAIIAAGPADGEDAKTLEKRGNAAYKAALRAWQDSYHETVGVHCGLTRLGPQRRQLTRGEWQREKVQAQALQKVVERARKVKASGDDFVTRTKTEAETIRATVAREQEAAARTAKAALAAEERAQKAQEAAKEAISHASRYSGLAGRVRALWDGFRRSKVAATIRQEFGSEIEQAKAFARSVQTRLKAEEKRRYDAERKAHEAQLDAERARDAALRMQIERDRALSFLSPEKQQELAAAAPGMRMTLRPKQKKEGK